MSRIAYIAAGVAMLAAVSNAYADSFYFGAGTGEHTLSFDGSYGNDYVWYPQPMTAEVLATIDTLRSEFTYDRLKFTTGQVVVTLSQEFTSPAGQPLQITTTLTFDPASASLTDLGPFNLTEYPGRVYDIAHTGYPDSWSFQATGTYRVEGPTETISGSFSEPRTVFQGGLYPHAHWDLHTISHPDEYELIPTKLAGFQSVEGQPIVDVTVDGVPIQVDCKGSVFRFDDPLPLTRIPEPTTLALLPLAPIAFRRRR